MGPQEPTAYRLKKLTEIEAYLLDEIKARERVVKKDETIQHNDKRARYRSNSIYRRGFHCRICKRYWPSVWIALSRNSLLFSLAIIIT